MILVFFFSSLETIYRINSTCLLLKRQFVRQVKYKFLVADGVNIIGVELNRFFFQSRVLK